MLAPLLIKVGRTRSVRRSPQAHIKPAGQWPPRAVRGRAFTSTHPPLPLTCDGASPSSVSHTTLCGRNPGAPRTVRQSRRSASRIERPQHRRTTDVRHESVAAKRCPDQQLCISRTEARPTPDDEESAPPSGSWCHTASTSAYVLTERTCRAPWSARHVRSVMKFCPGLCPRQDSNLRHRLEEFSPVRPLTCNDATRPPPSCRDHSQWISTLPIISHPHTC